MSMQRPSIRRARTRRANSGFTLIEVLFALVLGAMISGVVAAGLITALNVFSSTNDQVTDSTDAGLISSFLVRDAQSAGGIDPATALPDPTLGVSSNPADVDGKACMTSGSVTADVKARFKWIDRTSATANTNVVVYALDTATHILTRHLCTNGAYVVQVALGRNITSAAVSCQYEASPLVQPSDCSGHPMSVSMTLEGKGTRAPLKYTLTASLRSAPSLMAIMLPTRLEDGRLGVPYASAVMSTIGASAQTKWSQTGLPVGLTIDPWTGMIYGTPNPTGPFPLTSTVRVTVADVLFATTATRTYPIVIHGPPVAVADGSGDPKYATNEDTPLTVAAPGVLVNDSRREGNLAAPAPTKATLASGVAHGKLVFNADGSFTYTPELNYFGGDSFTYRANDSVTASDGSVVQLESAPVLVTLTVRPINDAPVNQVPVAQETAINTPEEFSNASNRISIRDVDAGTATVRVQLAATGGTLTLPGATGLVSSTGSGTAAMTITGSIANINVSLARATFTPTLNFIGVGSLTIATNDLGNSPAVLLPDTVNSIPITVRSLGIFTDKKDIGTVSAGPTGSSYSPPTYTVAGSGRDIWDNEDGFQFIYRSLATDGSLTAKVVSENVTYGTTNADPSCFKTTSQQQRCKSVAKAGVMFRPDLTNLSALDAMVGVTQDNGSEFIYRQTAGALTNAASPADGLHVPYWVRLTRHGNQITGEISADGTTWTQRGTTQTVGFGSTIYVGLAVSAVNQLSGDDPSRKLNTATFDNVSISTPPVAVADSFPVSQNTTTTVPAVTGLLANDSDPESNSLTARVVTTTAGLTLNPDGSFTFVPPANFGGTTFTYVANDGAFDSAPVTVTLTVNTNGPTNTMPSFTKGVDQSIRANLGTQSVPQWATAITPGAGDAGQLVDFIVTNSNNALFSVQPSISADGTLTFAPAPADALSGEGAHGTAVVSVIIHDNGGTANGGIDTSGVQTFTITIVAPPVLTPTTTSLPYTENGAPIPVDPGITVTDADSTTLVSATVAVASGYVNGQDLLSFANQNGITGLWNPATGVYALTGTTSIANYQAALRSITYSNASDNPSTVRRAITFVASDGQVSGRTATRTITLTAVNDPPVNSVPGPQTATKAVARVFSSANGNLISISDPDAGAGSVQVQLVSTNGTATLSGNAGLTLKSGDSSSADADMTFTGTISDINTALAGMSFAPNPSYAGNGASLRVVTSDQGNTGIGGALVDDDSVAITVWSPDCPTTINGWRGQYYGTDSPTGTPVFCRDDPQVNFNWGNSAPDPALPADHFSVRWTRTQSFAAGYYAFTMGSDDDSKLYIDPANDPPSTSATPIITASYNAPSTSSPVFLAAGNHTIVMEYHESGGGALANLTWLAVAPPSCSTPPSGSSTAWFGQYFSNTNFNNGDTAIPPTECRNDASINFNWGNNAPITGMLPDGFSVRWTKTQTFAAGTYSFILGGDDGIRLRLDGVLVPSLNSWSDHSYPGSPTVVNLAMAAGDHTLVVEFYENGGGAQATLDVINPLTFGAFTNSYWSGAGSTVVYYRSATSGSFTTFASSTEATSGITGFGFPALGNNWTSTPGALGVNSYSWSASPAAPGTKSVTATNGSGLTATGPSFTPTADDTAPTSGSVDYLNGSNPSTSVNVTFTTGTDNGGSGIGTRQLQRQSAPLTGSKCGAFGAFATVTNGTNPTSPFTDTVTLGNCYMYRYVVADNVGNVDTAVSPNILKVRKTYFDTVTGTPSLLSYWRLGESAASLITADSFTGTTGTILPSHVGELGATWVNATSASNKNTETIGAASGVSPYASNRVYRNGTGYSLNYTTANPATADYSVAADLFVKTYLTGDMAGVVGRLDTAANTAYVGRWERATTSWNILEFRNGAITQLASATGQAALTAGETYRIRLEMTGSNPTVLNLYVNGVLKVTYSDNAAPFTAAGKAGILDGNSVASITKAATTGIQFDNFQVTPSTYPHAVDSDGLNNGDYFAGPTLGVTGAIADDSDTAATFDGSSDYVQAVNTTSIPVGASARSVEIWFKTSSLTKQVLFAYGARGTGKEFGLWLNANAGGINTMTAWASGSGDKTFTTPSVVSNGAWHQVVETYDGTKITLYIDGVALPSQSVSLNTGTVDAYGFAIGAVVIPADANSNFSFNGSLDEVSLYSAALDAATVKAHFDAGQ